MKLICGQNFCLSRKRNQFIKELCKQNPFCGFLPLYSLLFLTWTPAIYMCAYNFLCIHFYVLIKPSVIEAHRSLFNVLSHLNDVSCSLIDCWRFFYNSKFNILVWFDWLQFRAWNLEWSQMWVCCEGTTQSTPCTQKLAREKWGRNGRSRGRRRGVVGKWVSFYLEFPTSCELQRRPPNLKECLECAHSPSCSLMGQPTEKHCQANQIPTKVHIIYSPQTFAYNVKIIS